MSGGLLLLSLAVYLNDIREHFNEKTAKDILLDVDYKETRIHRRRRKNKIMTVMQLMLQRI